MARRSPDPSRPRWVLVASLAGALVASLGLGAGGGGGARADESPPGRPTPPEDPVAAALAQLGAPFLADREDAVAALVDALPDSRPAVIAAFAAADDLRRPLLVQVLAADATRESLDALLEALPATHDVATTSAIHRSLVEHAEALGDALLAWRDADGHVPPRIAELVELVQRARVEALFLSRKSRSGSTGSYPGQFEVLRADRRRALEVCLAVLRDRPMKIPGEFPAGSYRWLRPPTFVTDREELQHMALNAIAELATSQDTATLDALEAHHAHLEALVQAKPRWQARFETGLQQTILATLARLRPEVWRATAESLLDDLSEDLGTKDEAAQLALRMGEYARAVRLYLELQRMGEGAIASYNLACAFARWSQETEEGELAADRRERALTSIHDAVRRGYADWGWMEQDRDLDAIRQDPRFLALVAGLRAEFAEKPGPGPLTPPR